jgi:hypothetical protein
MTRKLSLTRTVRRAYNLSLTLNLYVISGCSRCNDFGPTLACRLTITFGGVVLLMRTRRQIASGRDGAAPFRKRRPLPAGAGRPDQRRDSLGIVQTDCGALRGTALQPARLPGMPTRKTPPPVTLMNAAELIA